MQKRRVIAYYRVSTQKQGVSGLGLEAQRKAVSDYLSATGDELIAEFTEVESGRKADRPQLAAALAMAKQEKATVAIAKLDRLARSVRFVSNLLDSGVQFVSVDMPEANRLVLHMMAAFAEHEAVLISQRTKAALAAAKARGVQLGKHAAVINAEASAAADAYASSLVAALAEIRASGAHSVRETAAALNARGIRTRRGSQWHPTSVQRLLERLTEMEFASLANNLRNYHVASN
ncbi:recombinase family protein [Methylobacterium sp. SD21]|uniref:recombinase family protein n=1 Tax=Methylobacterium litchii TaxID=3138810 RepID=UPI00313A99BF